MRGVMRPAVGDILRLIDPIEAWNIDGSADAVPDLTDTWIAEAEAVTGRRRGRCSFEGCPNMAAVGGHVWLANIGCVIAPICMPCNNPRNMPRRQGGGSRLRANIEVFRTHMTDVERPGRWCERCGVDISDRPRNRWNRCLNCFAHPTRRYAARWCRVCGVDISGAPPNRTVCLNCFRHPGDDELLRSSGRRCERCSVDISGAPPDRPVCLNCFAHPGDDELLRSSGRRCRVCGVDIWTAPPNHTVCLNCFRGVMRPAVGDILHLIDPAEAWIVEENVPRAGIEYLTSSWITDVEAATGRTRGWCSFEGCGNMAEVGGCVWFANIQRVVLAPICRACNDPGNMARRQIGKSTLMERMEMLE